MKYRWCRWAKAAASGAPRAQLATHATELHHRVGRCRVSQRRKGVIDQVVAHVVREHLPNGRRVWHGRFLRETDRHWEPFLSEIHSRDS